MNIQHQRTMNDRVIHNFHLLKKYFPNLDILAFESNVRLDELEVKQLEIDPDDDLFKLSIS